MPLRLPSPSSPTLATSMGAAVEPLSGGAAFQAAASASKAVSPAPLSATPGPASLPSPNSFMSSGLRGARTVSRCAVTAKEPPAVLPGKVATTLPARSRRASQPSARNCAAIQTARFSSKNVGAGMRHNFTCWSLIQLRSRRNQSRHARPPLESANSAMDRAICGKLQSTAEDGRTGPQKLHSSGEPTSEAHFGIAGTHPGDKSVRSFHGGEPPLAHQRPFSELLGSFDLRQSGGRFQASREFQIHYRRFRIFGVGTAFRQNLCQSNHPGGTSTLIDENHVARTHFPNGLDRLRICDAVPQGPVFPLEIGK